MERLPDELVARVQAHAAYRELRRARGRLSLVLTAIVLVAFFGFTLAIAFDKSLLAAPIGGGVTSLGIPLGFAIILLAILLTGLYVRAANRRFDALTDQVRRDVGA